MRKNISMKKLLTEWKKLTESTITSFPGPSSNFQQLADWFNTLAGSRMVFYDIETIGTTFGDFQDRVPQQISELYALGFDCPSYMSAAVVETNQLPEQNVFHYLADLTKPVQARRELEKSLTYQQAVEQGLERYVMKDKKKARNQPWNVQDYIDYTQREQPAMIDAIKQGKLKTAAERDMLEQFANFIVDEFESAGAKLYICGRNIINFDNEFIKLCAKNYPEISEKIESVFNDSRVEFLDTLTLAKSVNNALFDAMQRFNPEKRDYANIEQQKAQRYIKSDIYYMKNNQIVIKNSMAALSKIYDLIQKAAHTASDDVNVNIRAFAEMFEMTLDLNYKIKTTINIEDFK